MGEQERPGVDLDVPLPGEVRQPIQETLGVGLRLEEPQAGEAPPHQAVQGAGRGFRTKCGTASSRA